MAGVESDKCRPLRNLFLRKHKFLILDSEGPRAVIWDPLSAEAPKILNVQNSLASLPAVTSHHIYFPVLNIPVSGAISYWTFEVFEVKSGKKIQTHRVEKNPYRIQHSVVIGEWLFFDDQFRIFRINLVNGKIGEEETVSENLKLVLDLGRFQDKLFAVHGNRLVIWDPDKFESLERIYAGGADRAFPIPGTGLIVLNGTLNIVDVETNEETKLTRPWADVENFWFFPDGRMLKRVKGKNPRMYAVIGDRKKPWSHTLPLKSGLGYRVYDSGLLLTFSINGNKLEVETVPKGDSKPEKLCSDSLVWKEAHEYPLPNRIPIGDVIEIPLSETERNQEAERFSRVISVAPIPKDIAKVIGKFI